MHGSAELDLHGETAQIVEEAGFAYMMVRQSKLLLVIVKEELEGIAKQEICDTRLDDSVELAYLTDTR